MKAKFTKDSLSPEMLAAARKVAIEIAEEEYSEIQERQLKRMWAITLWTLYIKWGFGKIRLNRLFDDILSEYDKAREKYELDQPITAKSKKVRAQQVLGQMHYGDLCTDKLLRIGVDVKAMVEESEK